MSTTPDNAVATQPVFSEDALADIQSFEDAIALLADAGIDVTDVTDYGDGFSVMDKHTIVNVPFIILDYKFIEDGKYGSDFVVVRAVTSDGRKAIFTDGGTGIREQVRSIMRKQEAAQRKAGGIMVKNGLTISEYTFVDSEGKTKPAETFYLSM